MLGWRGGKRLNLARRVVSSGAIEGHHPGALSVLASEFYQTAQTVPDRSQRTDQSCGCQNQQKNEKKKSGDMGHEINPTHLMFMVCSI